MEHTQDCREIAGDQATVCKCVAGHTPSACTYDVQNNKQLGHFGNCALITQPEHSPTPWEIDPRENSDIRSLDGWHLVTSVRSSLRTDPKANAEYIVRAVNAHEALLKAAKLLIQLDDECHARPNKLNGLLDKTRAEYLAVIAKVEGK